jgi:hypothetical protein
MPPGIAFVELVRTLGKGGGGGATPYVLSNSLIATEQDLQVPIPLKGNRRYGCL